MFSSGGIEYRCSFVFGIYDSLILGTFVDWKLETCSVSASATKTKLFCGIKFAFEF